MTKFIADSGRSGKRALPRQRELMMAVMMARGKRVDADAARVHGDASVAAMARAAARR